MFNFIKDIFKACKGINEFKKLSDKERSIVFYQEDASSWIYLQSLVKEIARYKNDQICVLTSSLDDPILKNPPSFTRPIFIGTGMTRIWFFQGLKAQVIVMTMPDLEAFHIKRSIYPAHYVYVPHSIVSSHMIYRTGAFDHFDSVFCVGPHHVNEIREWEKINGLKEKELVKYGYGLLDDMLEEFPCEVQPSVPKKKINLKKILIAPSWGSQALLEMIGQELVEVLLSAGYAVCVRPHPRTVKTNISMLTQLTDRYGSFSSFKMDIKTDPMQALKDADVLISDWSGVALEYAFWLHRPPLYIDLPRKVNNPEYQRISSEPIEAELRTKIGVVVPLDELKSVPSKIEFMLENPIRYRECIRKVKSDIIYNLGNSSKSGARYILDLKKKL
tara:strand:- start:2563 stop:3726 length:1164 start_codon:yes stop_codon:yes gene_type:complete